jgi:hypothetical protein
MASPAASAMISVSVSVRLRSAGAGRSDELSLAAVVGALIPFMGGLVRWAPCRVGATA